MNKEELMIRKILIYALVLTMIISTNTVFANEEIDNVDFSEQEEKIAASSKNTISDSMTIEEAKTIEELYQKRLQLEKEKENVTAKLLYQKTKSPKLMLKANSNLKKDKIDAMLAMTKIIKSQRLSTEELQMFNSYISKYAPYAGNKYLEDYNQEIVSASYPSTRAVSSYNSTAAVNYAYQYWNSFNTSSYPNLTYLGGDCANFVSQCLYAGGVSMQGDWYISKLNNNNPAPVTTTQLDNSWQLADPSPWISAKEFNDYWGSRANHTIVHASDYVYNYPTQVYLMDYYKGDVVQILAKELWWWNGYHTMIITNYGSNDYLLTYHSTEKKDVTLNSIASRFNSSSYRFKFFAIN